MSWVCFELLRRRKVSTFIVKITPQEKFFINRPLVYKLKLDNDYSAQIFYDSSSLKVAIAFATDFKKSCLPLRGINQKNVYIHAPGFYNYFDLKIPQNEIRQEATIENQLLITFNIPVECLR